MKHLADLNDPKIAPYYDDVPAGDMQRFRSFCRAFPYHQVSREGIEWPYLMNARKGETLLLLSGAMVIPDISWHSIAHFGESNHVIAPSYPPVKTMTELVDGIAVILQQEGIKKVHVLGGSYGGFVAQIFVRRYPRICHSLVLSHTFAPNPADAGAVKKMVSGLKWLPQGALKWTMGRKLLKLMPEDKNQASLMLSHFKELLHERLTRADILGILWRMGDYYQNEFTPGDLAGWPGRVLLVMADDDPGTPELVRERLIGLYPGASVKLFHGSGHATSVVREDEYQAVIDEFLGNKSKKPGFRS